MIKYKVFQVVHTEQKINGATLSGLLYAYESSDRQNAVDQITKYLSTAFMEKNQYVIMEVYENH